MRFDIRHEASDRYWLLDSRKLHHMHMVVYLPQNTYVAWLLQWLPPRAILWAIARTSDSWRGNKWWRHAATLQAAV
jgi:hypothetical protein